MSTARERLLAQLLVTFGEELPPRGTSLREIAARTGTSHALLRYHFDSHAGVLAAMLVAQRRQDNDALAAQAETASFAEFVERIWAFYADPRRLARIRGFFLVAGFAAQEPETFTEFVATLDDLQSLLAQVAHRDGASAETAALRAAVTVATLRGMLLQEVLSPGSSTEAALRLALRFDPIGAHQEPSPPSDAG